MAPRSSSRGATRFEVCGKEVAFYPDTSRVTLFDGLNARFDKEGSPFNIQGRQDKYLPIRR